MDWHCAPTIWQNAPEDWWPTLMGYWDILTYRWAWSHWMVRCNDGLLMDFRTDMTMQKQVRSSYGLTSYSNRLLRGY